MKRIIIILALLLIPSFANAATIYKSTGLGTGLWSDTTGTWVTSSGGSTPSAAPTSSDTAVLDANSSNLALDNTTNACHILNCTGYTGTFTFTAGKKIVINGNITNPTGVGGAFAGTGTLEIDTACTYVVGTVVTTFPGALLLYGAISFSADYTVSGLVTTTNSYTYSGGNLICNGGLTVGATSASSSLTFVITGGTVSMGGFNLWANLTIKPSYGTVTVLGVNTQKILTYTPSTYTANMSSSQLNITTSLATFNTNGLTWATAVISNGPATLTSNFQCTTLRVAASVTWAGAYDITCANLVESNAGGITLTIPTGRTLDVSNSIAFGTGITSTASLITSSNTSAAYINYTGTPASCLLYNTNFTHITASGNPLYDFGSATLSSTSGISNINLGALIKNGMFIQ